VLVGGALFSRHRLKFLLGAVAGFCVFTYLWYAFIGAGWLPRPSGSSPIGYACGVMGALIILFEMLLWPRKILRRFKLFGSTRLWMFLHIWLGLLSVPLVFGHSGFIYGRLMADAVATNVGLLSATLMTLYLIVIASGVFGLAMQQIIPQKLLDEIPGETIATQREHVAYQFLEEARGLMARLTVSEGLDDDHGAGVAVAVQTVPYRVKQLSDFFKDRVTPYLEMGKAGGQALASPARAEKLFAELRRDAGQDFGQIIDRLKTICDWRRQLDRQYDLYWWLHSWLCIHLPLSIALFALLVIHIGYALKYW
jgi:hypothetical protein